MVQGGRRQPVAPLGGGDDLRVPEPQDAVEVEDEDEAEFVDRAG